MLTRPVAFIPVSAILAICLTTACQSGEQTPAGAPGGGSGAADARPPAAVEMVTLAPKPIEQTTEFVGTIKSRRSTTIQPQVEGFITNIHVKSGDHVNAGAVLMDIDARSQEAAIASLESVKAQRDIDVTYARQESDRARKLLDAGASSQMDADRAVNALKAAEAQVRTVEEQLRQARTDLAYYKVTAPTSGVVGDIPIRVGDRVTKSTELTTVEANEGLELYLNVPVQEAAHLRSGLPVRLLGEDGKPLASAAISFVSPSVDTTTQTVLAKVPVAPNSGFRTSQYVRAQIVWTTEPTLTVPVTAVQRINGQYFVFVAETTGESGRSDRSGRSGPSDQTGASGQSGRSGQSAAGPSLVARQRPVMLGNVIGNDYVVLGGLKEGAILIASGVQKIADGAAVTAATSGEPGRSGPSGPTGESGRSGQSGPEPK